MIKGMGGPAAPVATESPMRLGLFGGTFDPIHLGHLILAEACREACALDLVWFVVTATPPHKRGGRTSIQHRLEMARIAVAGNPAFEVSEIEARTPGPHYSYQTLESLREERPGDDLFFLVGADSLVDLPGWRHPERVLAAAELVVVNRPGIDPAAAADPASALAPLLARCPEARPVRAVEVPPIGISSTDLRLALAAGRSVRYRVPRGVEAYIDAQRLYRD
jgi:nicotinate-nucleotide adenylyltransferase